MCAIRPQWHTWHTLALALALAVLAVLVLAVLVLALAVCWHTRHTALVLRGQRGQRGPAPWCCALAAPRPGVAGPSG